MTKFNNIKIYPALVSVIVALLFSGCIEETPKETNTTTIPSIKPKAEVIEQELKYIFVNLSKSMENWCLLQ